MKKCTAKLDFLKCLECSSLEPPEVEAKIIDEAAFIKINTPKMSSTFREYCSVEVMKKVCQISQGIVRLDFVFDTYKSDSIEGQTRENRGKGIRISFRKKTEYADDFKTL